MLIHTNPHVYGPEEDTYLLLEALDTENLWGDGLEIGVGTGTISLHVCHHFNSFKGVDINPHAVELATENARLNRKPVDFLVSDLFSHVSESFDVIIFNPPYVPADENITTIEDLSYHGGETGRRVIDQFLAQFPCYLKPGGTVYLLQSSLSGIEETMTLLKKKKFSSTILARKRLFFEELVVLKIRRDEMTRREYIIETLKKEEMTSQQLAHAFRTTKKTILSDLNHIKKSLKNQHGELAIRMPVCRACGFQFTLTTVREPSKCPHCNSTWIEPPTYKVIT